MFKHHRYFAGERQLQATLYPHACLHCRKTFRKPATGHPCVCCECAGPLVKLSRKFKSPKSTDTGQWDKVRFLVAHGFLFQSVYQPSSAGQIRVPYPKTLQEAHAFVEANKRQGASNA